LVLSPVIDGRAIDCLYDSSRIATDNRTCRYISGDDGSRCCTPTNPHIIADGDGFPVFHARVSRMRISPQAGFVKQRVISASQSGSRH
jgi:hypothetical protein